jgi:hypothetical protein
MTLSKEFYVNVEEVESIRKNKISGIIGDKFSSLNLGFKGNYFWIKRTLLNWDRLTIYFIFDHFKQTRLMYSNKMYGICTFRVKVFA